MNRSIHSLVFVVAAMLVISLITPAHAQQRAPRDPAAAQRYASARAEARRYDSETARWRAEYESLRRSDGRYFKPLRRAADGAMRYGSRAAGAPGRAIYRTYRQARDRMGGYGQ